MEVYLRKDRQRTAQHVTATHATVTITKYFDMLNI